MKKWIRVIIVCAITGLWVTMPVHAKSNTYRVYRGSHPFKALNPYKPRTMSGVHNAYYSLVHRKNGVDVREAKIIAQYWLIQEHLYLSYDFRKPKLITESADQWQIRFPGKYSLTKKKVENYVFCIDKQAGKIVCAQPAD